jgi:hypothetical protein
MSNTSKNLSEKANSQLDALLRKGIQADKRATKPPMPQQAYPTPSNPASVNTPVAPHPTTVAPIQTLDRLTVRFTKAEAEMLEKARGVARSMGYKISDNVVFRLALNAFKAESITPQMLESILSADGRRKHP